MKDKTNELLKELIVYFIAMIIFFAIVGSILGSFIILISIAYAEGIKLSGFNANYFLIQTAIAAFAIAWAVIRTMIRNDNTPKKSDGD